VCRGKEPEGSVDASDRVRRNFCDHDDNNAPAAPHDDNDTRGHSMDVHSILPGREGLALCSPLRRADSVLLLG